MLHKFLAVTVSLVSITCLHASFVWKQAVDGDWMTGDNWLDGNVPYYVEGSNVSLTNDSGEYSVGLSNSVDQVIWGLQIQGKSSGDKRTSLRMENSSLNIQNGKTSIINGEIRIGPNAVLDISNGFVDMPMGGRIFLEGGTLVATNKFKQMYVDSTEYNGGRYPLFKIDSGNAYIKYTQGVSDIVFRILDYARLEMTGGKLEIDSNHRNNAVLNLNSNGDASRLMDLSGSAVIKILNGSASFGRGVCTLRDNASIEFTGNDLNLCSLQPYFSDNGRKMEFNLMDNSSFKVRTAKFYFGKPDARTLRTVGKFNISGGNHTFGRYCELGCGHGEFTTEITGGHTEFIQYGLRIGAYPANPQHTDKSSAKAFACTGIVNVAGGVLNLNPTECHSPSAVKGVWGTVIGYGAKNVFSGWFDGRLNISGNAVVTNGAAPMFVGAGNAVGSIVQTGGELYAKEDSSKYWARSALVLGIFGGQGSYAMSGGKSEFNNHVYVGGVDLISVGRTEAQNHMPENDGSSSGVLEVSGGTFTVRKSMYVGALGTGTVNLSGSGSLLIAESLVLSNSVPNAATVKLEVSGDTPPRFEIGGELVVRDGAKLEVDVSNFATTNVWTKLISCSSRTGSFASSNVKVVGEGVRGYLVFNRVNDGTGSIWWCRPRGTAVVIR